MTHTPSPSRKVSRHFGAVNAVDAVDLEIARGRVLRHARPVRLRQDHLPAPDRRLRAADRRATSRSSARRAEGVPPYRRNVNTVFQDYALFPHLNVLDNVAYGLMVKGVGKAERRREAPRRRWSWCSCPATARAGRASSPAASASAWRSPARSSTSRKVLLLDEPLGALDLKLREQMQEELKALQRRSASPSSSSPTTRARRCRWPTASPCSTTAGSCRSARRRRSTSARRRASSPISSARPTCCRPISSPLGWRSERWASLRPESDPARSRQGGHRGHAFGPRSFLGAHDPARHSTLEGIAAACAGALRRAAARAMARRSRIALAPRPPCI